MNLSQHRHAEAAGAPRAPDLWGLLCQRAPQLSHHMHLPHTLPSPEDLGCRPELSSLGKQVKGECWSE